MSGKYVLMGSDLEKCGKMWKNGSFLSGSSRIGEMPHEQLRPGWGRNPANNFRLLQRRHNMTFLLWQRCKVTLQQRKFVDSQIGCDNVAKQRCCITKLQATYNLKIKITLNFINVRSFKYQLHFLHWIFLKVMNAPLIFFSVVTILSYDIICSCCNIVPNFPPVLVMELLRDVPLSLF